MRYIRVERTSDGYCIDPTDYIAQLPQLAGSLPAGAGAFATDPQHYDFHSTRFVKNLKPQKLVAGHTDGDAWLEFQLRHNCWRHEEDLTIRYSGVSRAVIHPPAGNHDIQGLQEVLLDEILPHNDGCSHEIVCLGGSVTIVCNDLTATWTKADCPDR
ncbi:hypothetical protein Rhe02_34520 [Rhizocola hellebori]|uniref:Uncharacterized protein n=1 Tax=Rhizocola hellebori TaxID=1392758 RepID=A0A8J3Q7R1_9ACTN|nr:hypothetical protein [Rhizocola hellebori]GIH05385.1 hypothetical protein Rhe02_34520 [Rhizocola hellebori]